MTDSDLVLRSDEGAGEHLPASGNHRRRLTAISARAGVLGIIGGLATLIVGPAPVVGLGVTGLSFLAGGLGVIGMSILLLTGFLSHAFHGPGSRWEE